MISRMEKLHLYICIAAALIVTVVCILREETLYGTAVLVSLTIIIFYVLGQIFRIYLSGNVFKKAEIEAAADVAIADAVSEDMTESSVSADESENDAEIL